MEKIELYAGLKLDAADGKSWRLLDVSQIGCVMIEMIIKYKHIVTRSVNSVIDEISSGKMAISDDQEKFLIDMDSLSEKKRKEVCSRISCINEIEEIYGPGYLDFMTNTPKSQYHEIIQKYGLKRRSADKYLLRWLQSGKQLSSMIDPRKACGASRKPANFTTKTGCPCEASGIIVDTKVTAQFDAGIVMFRKTRAMTKRDAFLYVLWMFYSEGADTDRHLLPENMRPTERQFRYYFSKQISRTEEQKIKTSREEFYNDCRALFGFNRDSAIKPGYIVEVDALEVDINIVSSFNNQQNISRPIVYAMVDLYSHAIVAFHIGFDNNSMMGLSSLMLNLFDDKKLLLDQLDIKADPTCWPSRFIPNEIRCDRGSDFASDKFEKICNDLGIRRTLEPGATGSLKGLIERSFGEFHQSIKPHLEKMGIMQKRYDSNHKKEACLTIKEIYLVFVMFVIEHNRHYFKDWRLTPEMIQDGVEKKPISIWEWGAKHKGHTREVTAMNYENCLFMLLPENDATLTREGIKFRNLIYRVEKGSTLSARCVMSKENGNRRDQTGRKLNSITVRYDPRSIDNIYILDKGKLESLPLNTAKSGGLKGITWDEYDDYREIEKEMNKKGLQDNIIDRISRIDFFNGLKDAISITNYASTKFTNEFRKIEKNEVNYDNRIEKRIEETPAPTEEKSAAEKPDMLTENPEICDLEIKEETQIRKLPEQEMISAPIDAPECPDELCDFL